ncbi:hypothetical protein ABPG72_009562 [Tetrahymena utriculariae]
MENQPFCEFCDIFQNKKNLIIFKNDIVFAIEDIDLASSQRHILVCPIKHIENSNNLTNKDLQLLDEIHKVCELILQKSHPGKEYKYGFHIPPHVSIDHLHYHGIVLPIRDQFFGLVKFGRLLYPMSHIKEIISQQNAKKQE